jgi:hypothetical protein
MPNLRPLRDYSEHDVLNGFYAFSGSIPATKGTFVKIASGWSSDAELSELGNAGAAYNNVVSQRVGLSTTVGPCNGSGDSAIGCLLYDVRETDENGILLKWDAAKQARMQCVLSGQSTVILRKGLVHYSGVVGAVTAGGAAYLGMDGNVNGTVSGTATLASIGTVTRVGTFLGLTNAQGWVLLDIDL